MIEIHEAEVLGNGVSATYSVYKDEALTYVSNHIIPISDLKQNVEDLSQEEFSKKYLADNLDNVLISYLDANL